MFSLIKKSKSGARRSGVAYRRDDEGVAAIEFSLVFPVMFLMMLGVWEVGHLLWAGQKVITTSQVVADLIGRELIIDSDELGQVLMAAELTMQPFDTESLFIEILSVGFNADGEITEDEELKWEATSSGVPVGQDLYAIAEDLAIPYDGLILVRVNYDFNGTFGDYLFDQVDLEEIAFSRGRRTSVVVADFD